jgi:putative SOS response-associated peptidase YedK
MCGRTTLTITPDDLERTFGFPVPSGYRPRYNISPGQEVLAVADAGGGPSFGWYRWGLVPFWAKESSIGSRMINARGETVANKPAYRASFGKRRCLLVVDGFYEWRATPEGKRPHRIRLASGEPFTLAGIWDRWTHEPEHLETCASITTTANTLMAPIHDRMPVIVSPADRASWLAGETPRSELEALLKPYAGDDLVAYEVSTLVNRPINDTPECVEPVTDPIPFA